MTEPHAMTEPHRSSSQADSGAEAVRTDWPVLPAERDEDAGAARLPDAEVATLLERLNQLPDLEVAVHGEVYAGLHDDLLAALNDPAVAATPQERSV